MSSDDEVPTMRTLNSHTGAAFEAGSTGRARGEQLDGVDVKARTSSSTIPNLQHESERFRGTNSDSAAAPTSSGDSNGSSSSNSTQQPGLRRADPNRSEPNRTESNRTKPNQTEFKPKSNNRKSNRIQTEIK